MDGTTEQWVRRLEKVEAQLAIQQLASRYARAVDSRNLADLGELFAPQTRFGDHGAGAEGARAFYGPVLAGFYRSFHQIVGHVITDIEPDSARGTVYCRAEHEDGDHWIVNLMVYFDRYVRVEGGWHFLGRRPRFLFVGDPREAPRSLDFNTWPGREDRFTCELPQSDESWGDYWAQHADARGRVTSLP
ncbi:nuclear transport factor 2 family protein [Sphingopyxis sp. PET50]|uniref:nuclear transport factor 2 family protein n=1 Tax=Sphingopyxis sp. PET50 TaxID=2976533 RepID=UPI0021AE7A12|nr:nuclear transport factor 2 family protein [Sphingopyxis sp. PET50]